MMGLSNMKETRTTKVSKHSPKAIPNGEEAYYRVIQEKSSSEVSNQNLGTNKRLKKQKLLLQIAILGFITWAIILFLNHVIENNDKSADRDFSSLSDFMALSDLQVSQDDYAIQLPLQKHTTANAHDLRLRLQNIRMHNVLRASNSSLIIYPNASAKTEYQVQLSTAKNTSTTNLRSVLVNQWEKEFLGLEN